MGSRTDYFEVVLPHRSCFLVNYVMADRKTNFAEGRLVGSRLQLTLRLRLFIQGVTLITFYAMIVSVLETRHGKRVLTVYIFSGDGDVVLSGPAPGGLPAQLPRFRRGSGREWCWKRVNHVVVILQ